MVCGSGTVTTPRAASVARRVRVSNVAANCCASGSIRFLIAVVMYACTGSRLRSLLARCAAASAGGSAGGPNGAGSSAITSSTRSTRAASTAAASAAAAPAAAAASSIASSSTRTLHRTSPSNNCGVTPAWRAMRHTSRSPGSSEPEGGVIASAA
ncbi:hypothetical protein Vretifemale_13631 [Volvox reticuliferus]|uniref:Uncharacterized protein n=1 Tax=Volvox reticuliferus TaxID=1737510 RepID=A0A8J4FSA3_9CHLO|nr:hypothetical protein Vretifemale_13631 [Volvox reticuliferus]